MAFPVPGNGWLNLPFSAAARFSERPDVTRFMRLLTLTNGRLPGSASRSDRPPMCRPIPVHRPRARAEGWARDTRTTGSSRFIGRIRSMRSRACFRYTQTPSVPGAGRVFRRSTVDDRFSLRVIRWWRFCGRAVKRPSDHAAPAKFTACPAADLSDRLAASWNTSRRSPTAGNLRGICPTCHRAIHRRVNWAKLSVVTGDLEVTLTAPAPRLLETYDLPVNCELESEEAA